MDCAGDIFTLFTRHHMVLWSVVDYHWYLHVDRYSVGIISTNVEVANS